VRTRGLATGQASKGHSRLLLLRQADRQAAAGSRVLADFANGIQMFLVVHHRHRQLSALKPHHSSLLMTETPDRLVQSGCSAENTRRRVFRKPDRVVCVSQEETKRRNVR
jgi:hypothetical protein